MRSVHRGITAPVPEWLTSDLAILSAGPEWFTSKILSRSLHDEAGCLLWSGYRDHRGYGRVRTPAVTGGRLVGVHRAALVLQRGEPLPDGWQVDHLCRVRHCLETAHLEAVTDHVNQSRGVGTRARACSECKRERDREFARRQSGAVLAAARSLGLTKRAYIAEYGQSWHVAQDIVAGLSA